MTTEELARLAKLYRETHDKDAGRRLDAAVAEVLHPKGPGLFDSPCDHAWEATASLEWRCRKCGATTNLTPRGQAGTPEKPPPGQGGEP